MPDKDYIPYSDSEIIRFRGRCDSDSEDDDVVAARGTIIFGL